MNIWSGMEQEKRTKIFSLAAGLLIAFSMIYTAKQIETVYTVGEAFLPRENTCVVVDPGHGGFDPGKVGINEALEKDINLAIAQKVAIYLGSQDIQVIMTREKDEGLAAESEGSQKAADMKARVRMIEEAKPDLAVSIHQNSYTQEYVQGAQVFYYEESEEGKQLAEYIQEQLVHRVDPENGRQVKSDNSYYLLKKTRVPIVIVECGFLSNRQEAEKLVSEEYQDQLAWAIYMGIMNYLNQ